MNFSSILFFMFACFIALASVSAVPEPRWKVFKKIVSIDFVFNMAPDYYKRSAIPIHAAVELRGRLTVLQKERKTIPISQEY